MNAAAGFLALAVLAVLPAYSQGSRQTAVRVRVEPQCGVTEIQHGFLKQQDGLDSGVTRFKILLRTSTGNGSASLVASFGPADARESIVSYRITLAGMVSVSRRPS